MTGVMQPYVFPYPGYFQLLHASDDFIFYDDVQFIKGGYINRNTLVNGQFTVPLSSASSFATIRDRKIDVKQYTRFVRKWKKGFALAYKNAPFYAEAASIIEAVFSNEPTSIAKLAEESVRQVCDFLGIDAVFKVSSDLEYDRNGSAQHRLLALLKQQGANKYVNSINGRHLYTGDAFGEEGIELYFIEPQLGLIPDADVRRYSILHLLAHYPVTTCREWVANFYTLHQASN